MTNISIRWKILILVASIFLASTALSLYLNLKQNEEQVLHGVKSHAFDLSSSYFDQLNTMMLTGVIANRGIVREKFMQNPEVIDARVMRSEAINKQYPNPLENEAPVDEWDHQVLKSGEWFEKLWESEEGRVFTVIKPAIATSEKLPGGLTCLNCHLVEEGTVLGAIRIDFSMAERDAQSKESAMHMALLTLGLFIGGLLLIFIVMDRVFLRPIRKIHHTIGRMAQGDLCVSLKVANRDEINEINEDLNTFASKLSKDLRVIKEDAENLASSAKDLHGVSGSLRENAMETAYQTNEAKQATEKIQENIETTAKSAQGIDETVHRLSDSASAVRERMGRVAGVMGESQKNLDSLAVASNQIAGAIGEIASNTDRTRAEAGQAVESVAQARTSILELSEVTEEIGKVVLKIEDIAEQTQTLALNATIEAARAGAAGRGFAVVAEQVRMLAKQTNDATADIQDRVHAIQRSTGITVDEIERINAVIGQVNDMVESIAVAVEESSATTQENSGHIDSMVTGFGEVTEQVNGVESDVAEIADAVSGVAGEAQGVSVIAAESVNEVTGVRDGVRQVNDGTLASARNAQEVTDLAGRVTEAAGRLREMVDRFKLD